MNKYFFTGCLLLITVSLFAQKNTKSKSEKIDYFKGVVHERARIALKAGFNYNTARVLYAEKSVSSSYLPGINIGILIKTVLERNLHFSPYFGYSMRGYSHNMPATLIAKYENYIHYFDMVPAFSYDIAKKNHSFVVSAGPYISVALAGTEKTTSTTNRTRNTKMKFSTDGDYGRFDMGVSTSIGYHMKKVFIEAGYQIGLTNINNNVDIKINPTSPLTIDPRDIRNRSFNLNIGYYLK